MGNRYRLVRYSRMRDTRRCNTAFGGKGAIARQACPTDSAAFADCCPYHMCTLASLGDLNKRLVAEGCDPATIYRFRPNIVLSGTEPYEEDTWAGFSVATPTSVGFRKLGSTARCVIPNVHPFIGQRDEAEMPREMLVGYRPMPYGDGVHGGPTFGLWMACDASEGEIRVGHVVMPMMDSKL